MKEVENEELTMYEFWFRFTWSCLGSYLPRLNMHRQLSNPILFPGDDTNQNFTRSYERLRTEGQDLTAEAMDELLIEKALQEFEEEEKGEENDT